MRTHILCLLILFVAALSQSATTTKSEPATVQSLAASPAKQSLGVSSVKQSLAVSSVKQSLTVSATKTAKSSSSSSSSTLTTDAKFDDQAVGGKYQLPMEALSVVENEKAIDDLIGVRKNFRDRISRSKGMR